MAGPLSAIEHVVVLMLENRSFDHMLGLLYADAGNRSPTGQPFDGLTGHESNLDASGSPVAVFPIQPSTPHAYYMPGADPGEGFAATNVQLFGSSQPPGGAAPTNGGFVTDYTQTLAWESRDPRRSVIPGTTAAGIMGVFTPQMLPVLSTLARAYAVSDRWFSSVPTETMPNRAFALAATSQGHMDDMTKSYTSPSIFGALTRAGLDWSIHGYSAEPLTRMNFPDTTQAPETHFGRFTDFQAAAARGTLPPFTFLEPSWESTGNSQHPNYDVALGEQLIHDVHEALRQGPAWSSTLLVITYDEHGGCYDHVAPPGGATPPDGTAGEFGFDFTRFGVRVPAVIVSPLIEPGTVLRAPDGGPPFDHTSILKTVESRWGVPPLTRRDAAAPDLGSALTLSVPRTDDPLQGVVVPRASEPNPSAGQPSHLQRIHAELVSRLPVPGDPHHVLPELRSTTDLTAYIEGRTADWKRSRGR